MRPLEKGEVGVSFFPNGIREILPESEFTLVDRMFQPGDLCKRSIDDVRSGVITSVDVKGRLEHAISGEPVLDWKSMNDIETPADVDIGDYVAYDNWIGQVRPLLVPSLQRAYPRSGCRGKIACSHQNIIVLIHTSFSTKLSWMSPMDSWYGCQS